MSVAAACPDCGAQLTAPIDPERPPGQAALDAPGFGAQGASERPGGHVVAEGGVRHAFACATCGALTFAGRGRA